MCCVWPQAALVSSSLEHPSNCPWPSQPWHLWKEQPSFVGSPTIWVYQVWHICQGQQRCDVMCVFLITLSDGMRVQSVPKPQGSPARIPLQWVGIWYLLGRYLETLPFRYTHSLYSYVYFRQYGVRTPVLFRGFSSCHKKLVLSLSVANVSTSTNTLYLLLY